jgi:aspartyl-tRNA(Asn)/glutamyl-tRNA(Gln) amidotransferase subunit B
VTTFDKYEAVIGLEVHAQLNTQSKLFCGDSAEFGAAPNTHISPITMAHPGTLPKMNKKAIELAIKLGLALNCDIEKKNYFARKNYFYPDLPKGYQISQHTTPICKNGFVSILLGEDKKEIRLNRIHLEEDAGKSIHDIDPAFSAIDLNRAGVPLLEIVTEPVLHSSEEAFAFLTELRKMLRWTDVCDGNMEEGSMRCDANVSIRIKGVKTLGTRVEVKNLNSIRNVKRAIDLEINRLIQLTENGQPIIQETRSYNALNNTTFSLRTKEDADDYRYFPDPDLTPFFITDEYLLSIQKMLPELPNSLIEKYTTQFNLSHYDASFICSDRLFVHYFEEAIANYTNYKAIVNWIMGPIKSYLNENELEMDAFPLSPTKLISLIQLVDEGKVNYTAASTKLFQQQIAFPEKSANDLAVALNLIIEGNVDLLEEWVNEVLKAMPEKVKEYQSGKKGLLGLFAGEVKRKSKGKADMKQVNEMLEKKLHT